MSKPVSFNRAHKRYYVDEAGDGVLFGPMGSDLLSKGEARRYFMLGFVEYDAPDQIEQALSDLRQRLMSDPLFSTIASLDPARKKTALFFHAKDDHPEIRIKVFEFIRAFDFKFSVVIKDMRAVKSYVESRNRFNSDYRYNPDELYDYTVRLLFNQRIHKADSYEIIFSRRGPSDRTHALQKQLEKLRADYGLDNDLKRFSVTVEDTRRSSCLQLIDYCLWAVQRAYERGEVRFLHAIWDKVSILRDVDHGDKQYGLYLTRKHKPQTTNL
ncbi:MAG: hypothetical protein EBU34_06455 [Alphaproteobacteria bacterium]|nr:hypothetical protein [Alphaproteobacteria bacterium]